MSTAMALGTPTRSPRDAAARSLLRKAGRHALRLSYPALLFGNALAAYNVAGIPVQWIATAATIAVAFAIPVLTRRLPWIPGGGVAFLLVFWLALVTFVNALAFDYEVIVPLVNTSYAAYVHLRFLNVLSLLATIALVAYLVSTGHRKFVIDATICVAVLVCLVAVYIYLAQSFGWPEPARSRMGTTGGSQLTLFTSANFRYHRAMGTFREPGHLGEWLVAPLYLTLIGRSVAHRVATLVIGGTLILTASLTGIFSAAAGFVVGMAAIGPTRPESRRVLFRIVLLALVGAGAAFAINQATLVFQPRDPNRPDYGAVLEVLVARVPQLFTGIEFNRAQSYECLRERGIPPWGYGLGQSNIWCSYPGGRYVVSFLSVYVNMLQSAGPVGLGLLAWFSMWPVVAAFRRSVALEPMEKLSIVGAYSAWLVAFSVGSEEFSFLFGVVYALLATAVLRPPGVGAGQAAGS